MAAALPSAVRKASGLPESPLNIRGLRPVVQEERFRTAHGVGAPLAELLKKLHFSMFISAPFMIRSERSMLDPKSSMLDSEVAMLGCERGV